MGLAGRRKFVVAAGALFAAPLAQAKQTGTVRRIGFLVPLPASKFVGTRRQIAFLEGLRSLGYVEGENLAIEWRFADGEYGRLPGLAKDLVALNVEVIVAASTPAIQAAQKATTAIPIVMAASGDPLRFKLIGNLAQPEGNTTGVSFRQIDTGRKLVEYLFEAVPNLRRVGYLRLSSYPEQTSVRAESEAAIRARGAAIVVVQVDSDADIEPAFDMLAQRGVDGVIVQLNPLVVAHARRIAALALEHRMPSAFGSSVNVDAGGFLSYGTSIARNFRRAAYYVHRLLGGAKPGDLPVEQSAEFELVVNLATAKTLGLTIPPSILLRADRVIE